MSERSHERITGTLTSARASLPPSPRPRTCPGLSLPTQAAGSGIHRACVCLVHPSDRPDAAFKAGGERLTQCRFSLATAGPGGNPGDSEGWLGRGGPVWPTSSPRALRAVVGPASSASAAARSRSGREKTGDTPDRPVLPGGEPEAQAEVEASGSKGTGANAGPAAVTVSPVCPDFQVAPAKWGCSEEAPGSRGCEDTFA